MDVRIFAETIEDKAKEQIFKLASQPAFENCKIRIMPDVHAGAGCVIGFTANLGDKVIPNVVGVDIGCGMIVASLGKKEIDLDRLDKAIREEVPAGRNVNEKIYGFSFPLERLFCYHNLKNTDWLLRSLGTLGGGNHFIEVDQDDEGEKYLIIHTGSRNLGKQVADYYQDMAIRGCKDGKASIMLRERERIILEYKATGRQSEISDALKKLNNEFSSAVSIPSDLCYLEGEEAKWYLHDMSICQSFAKWNRILLLSRIVGRAGFSEAHFEFETVHNYIDTETGIVRKGAVSADKGERLIIPMNMRDGCIIGVGKGNEEWNCSAPHGAGRIMSRMEARKKLSLEAYKESMGGIFSTSVSDETIDEAPMAYKPAKEIIDMIEPSVEIIKIIRPIYNFKAVE